ncbi:hypothetical protein GCM10007285_18590 [Stappia taiwanensis]|nr:hypothetical protein GCM10007285_18590 [Stappia taiwanensis]
MGERASGGVSSRAVRVARTSRAEGRVSRFVSFAILSPKDMARPIKEIRQGLLANIVNFYDVNSAEGVRGA